MQVINLLIIIPILIKIYNSLTIFQQAHYSIKGYLEYNIRMSLTLVIPIIISVMLFFEKNDIMFFTLVLYLFLYEVVNFRYFKIKLKYTKRVIRQLIIISIALLLICFYPFLYGILDFILIIPFSVAFLIEWKINRCYLKKASFKRKLYPLDVVSITGSFGKTTTKLFMSEILEDKRPYYTERSFNTPLGIARSINNEDLDIYGLLILEFGASRVNDIRYLSKLYKPNIAVVTAIGYMHLNGFKSIENIINEKMSIIEDLPKCGIGIINYDNDYIRGYKIKNNIRIISYGFSYGDFRIIRHEYYIEIKYLGINVLDLRIEHLSNNEILDMMPGLILGLYYNLDIKGLEERALKLKKPKARLEVSEYPKCTIINDSFNSNLDGALMGLSYLRKGNGIKYIITPGFVENDAILDELYLTYSREIKKSADYIFIIHSKSGDKLYKLLNGKNVFLIDSFKQAYSIFTKDNTSNHKTLLIENDLPDIYERMII